MTEDITIKLSPTEAADPDIEEKRIREFCGQPLVGYTILKKSLDARQKIPFFLYQVRVRRSGSEKEAPAFASTLRDVTNAPKVIVVGAGPCGYFAALQLIEKGFCPVVLDRGKDVRERRRDLRAIQQEGVVNPHSNYCFGEGGAGTYSDGKLYTRSNKRGNIRLALEILVEHGAKPEILYDAHPHIGSNKLPDIISNIRKTIEDHGGKVLFNHWVTDLVIKDSTIHGVIANGEEFTGEAVLLATGHSARDIYRLLHHKGVLIEAKPFALGVRIEHPQPLIDRIQYHSDQRDPDLPASSYSLTCQVDKHGVFSFCMCPGGLVVPSATAPGEIVVNGMSLSRRDSPFANSGTVTSVELSDLKALSPSDPFLTLDFQEKVEQTMFGYGDGSQKAPALRLTDFVEKKLSQALPDCSYIPGIYSAPLYELLPDFIYKRLRFGIKQFAEKMKGYYTSEANVIGVESRTSAPVRVPRDKETYCHPVIKGLYPAGEGAGYAGGIISAALDGMNVADKIAQALAR